jgi:hypothetical protein
MRFLLASLLLAFIGLPAVAAPLAYDEAISGDLGFGAVTVLPLDVGTNTVKGRMHLYRFPNAAPASQIDWDADPVELSLPAGQQITGFSISTSFNESIGNLASFEWSWYIVVDGLTSSVTCYAFIAPYPGCPTYSQTGGPLFAGASGNGQRFLITHASGLLWNDINADSGAWFDYTMTLNVAAVPEPTSSSLAVLACASMLMLKRRRNRRGSDAAA